MLLEPESLSLFFFFSDRFHKHHLRRSVSLKTLTVLVCVVAVHPGPCVFLMLRIRIECVFHLLVFFSSIFLILIVEAEE